MRRLTPRQREILNRLKRFTNESSLTALARELGMDYVSLRQHLRALDAQGFLRFESRGAGRPPMLRLNASAFGIPLIGDIPAGPVSEALEHPEGYIPLRSKPSLFALRVSGSSMAELIQDGDLVFIDKAAQPSSGQICAVRVDHSDVTLKYLEWRGPGSETLTLRAHNSDFADLTVATEDVAIEGVYQGLLRGNVADVLLERGFCDELVS